MKYCERHRNETYDTYAERAEVDTSCRAVWTPPLSYLASANGQRYHKGDMIFDMKIRSNTRVLND